MPGAIWFPRILLSGSLPGQVTGKYSTGKIHYINSKSLHGCSTIPYVHSTPVGRPACVRGAEKPGRDLLRRLDLLLPAGALGNVCYD